MAANENVLQWPSQSLDFKLIKMQWWDHERAAEMNE